MKGTPTTVADMNFVEVKRERQTDKDRETEADRQTDRGSGDEEYI